MKKVVKNNSIDDDSVADLRKSFKGDLIRPPDPGYDQQRRIWNGSIDRHPAMIARCISAADVQAAVRFARRNNLLAAVRGGGHSFPGYSVCDDGIVIDLGPMKSIHLDPQNRTVQAQAGVLLGELDRETQSLGMAVPAGIVTHTGIAGLTLGGGTGWIQRKFGLTIDNLKSVDLVTADGELIKANAKENPELFWGVRGGGGNFGIVTEFTYRMNPLDPQVVAGTVFWLMEDAAKVLRFYREWIANSPDELMTIVVQRKAPPLPMVPPELVGRNLLGIAACYAGSVEAGEKILQPLKTFGSPALDLCVPKLFVEHQRAFDLSFQPGWFYYVRSCDVAELNDDILDRMVEYGHSLVSPISSIALWQMGGAVSRVGGDETAFNGRNAGFTFNINGNSLSADGFEAEQAWARAYWSALKPYHSSIYVNFLMEEGEDRIRQAYGAGKYDRLKTLKRQVDPSNFFRLNQNIKPD